jgi:hypothetical protein
MVGDELPGHRFGICAIYAEAHCDTREGDMLPADELTVVRHDDTVLRFTDVRYTLSRRGLRVVLPSGQEIFFAQHDVLTTYARTDARTAAGTDSRAAYAIAA